jgi:hypothetical protein
MRRNVERLYKMYLQRNRPQIISQLQGLAEILQKKYPNARVFFQGQKARYRKGRLIPEQEGNQLINITTIGGPRAGGKAGKFVRKAYNWQDDAEATRAFIEGQERRFIIEVRNDVEDYIEGNDEEEPAKPRKATKKVSKKELKRIEQQMEDIMPRIRAPEAPKPEPKKRGRKPKPKPEPTEPKPEPKKRGPKPKPKPEPTEPVVKRPVGRPPKPKVEGPKRPVGRPRKNPLPVQSE